MPGRAFFSAAFLTSTLKVFSFDSLEINDSLVEKKRKGKNPTTIGVSACLLRWTQYFIWPQKYFCESIFALFQAELPAAFRTSACSVAQCWLIACSPVCCIFALQMTSVWIILSLPSILLNMQSFGILLAAHRGSGYLFWSCKAALMHRGCALFSLSSEAEASSPIWEASHHITVSIGLVLIDLPVFFGCISAQTGTIWWASLSRCPLDWMCLQGCSLHNHWGQGEPLREVAGFLGAFETNFLRWSSCRLSCTEKLNSECRTQVEYLGQGHLGFSHPSSRCCRELENCRA